MTWIDEYGGLPEGDTSLSSWIEGDDDDIPSYLLTCDKCGHLVTGDGSSQANCRIGDCIELRCANCGHKWGGWGPVGCPCQRRDPLITRIRRLYRGRRR